MVRNARMGEKDQVFRKLARVPRGVYLAWVKPDSLPVLKIPTPLAPVTPLALASRLASVLRIEIVRPHTATAECYFNEYATGTDGA